MKIELWYKDNILQNYLNFRDELECDVELIDEYRMVIKGIKKFCKAPCTMELSCEIGNRADIKIDLKDVDIYFIKLDKDEY